MTAAGISCGSMCTAPQTAEEMNQTGWAGSKIRNPMQQAAGRPKCKRLPMWPIGGHRFVSLAWLPEPDREITERARLHSAGELVHPRRYCRSMTRHWHVTVAGERPAAWIVNWRATRSQLSRLLEAYTARDLVPRPGLFPANLVDCAGRPAYSAGGQEQRTAR
jgi:hypothetical protein